MRKEISKLAVPFALIYCLGIGIPALALPQSDPEITRAKTIAIGIPGAGAVARVGDFIEGSLKNSPYAKDGRILDPNRVLVASSSNYGASVWIDDPGTILSIDPRVGDQPLVIPDRFAVGGGQVSILDGAVMVFTSNNTTFTNSMLNPTAITQLLSSVSVPTGIAISNATSQLAFSSSTGIRAGEGWLSVVNVEGVPIKGHSFFAGGVFAGARTNRDPIAGLKNSLIGGSMGAAYLGPSADGSKMDVFVVTNGDAGASQVHLEMGVDGLFNNALASYSGSTQSQESWGAGGVMNTRGGLCMQASPQRVLFVCDPGNNGIRAYGVINATDVFRAGLLRFIESPSISSPVDLAPAAFATSGPVSNTTLAPGADLYVASRGNGNIVRVRQNGEFVAARKLEVDGLGVIGPGWINGVALSRDGQSLYVTLTGPVTVNEQAYRGLLVSIPAF
ncbi:MAG: hypothetical protein HY650_10890 [Acidobacteria bacterium]|nr:hypothetical protein [Acidobacteriota bacterium]